MKDNPRSISKIFPFITGGLVSYLVTVTILLTVILVVGASSGYQIEKVEASFSQSANTSNVYESDIDPKNITALVEKGISLDELGKYEEAINWYDKALQIDPKDVYALHSKGVALANLGKYEEAITWYDKALAVDPKNVNALTNKGSALYNMGKKDDAFIWIDKALTIDPTNQQILDVKSQLQD